jgi:exopolysaccharide biosynthesis polyprenyl glycosylphosphotransferase
VTDTLIKPVAPPTPADEAQPGRPRHGVLHLLRVAVRVASDLAMVYAAYQLAYLVSYRTEAATGSAIPPPETYDELAFITAGCVLVAFAVYRLYIPRRGLSRIDLLYSVVLATTGGFLLGIAVIALAYRSLELPRLVIATWWLSAILLIWLARALLDSFMRILRKHEHDIARVVIVGAGESGQIVLEKIRHAPELGYRVVGFVDDGHLGPLPKGAPVLGTPADIPRLISQHHVSEIIIAAPQLDQRDILEMVASSARERVNVMLFPDIVQIMSSEITTSDLTGLPMVQIRDVALRGWNLALKRAMDIVLSAIGLILLSPVMLAIALLVKLTSRDGPVFYAQERVGLDGKPFQLVKFRSMKVDAEARSGPVWATRDDARRTRIGTWIRRWSLDELPQLINVLVGEMSLVGPRPERPHFVEQFSRVVPRYAERHNEKAGMTGWAQVNGLRGQASIEERTKYDVFYVENWSLAFDVKILLKTIATVFRDRSAY